MKIKLITLLLISGLMLNVSCSSSNDDTNDTQTAEAQDPSLDSEATQVEQDQNADANADQQATDEQVADDSQGPGQDTAQAADDFAGDEDVVADNGDDASADSLPSDSLDSKDAASSDSVSDEDLLADDGSQDNAQAGDVADNSATTDNKDQIADANTSEEGVFDSAAPTDDTAAASADTSSTDVAAADTAPEPDTSMDTADAASTAFPDTGATDTPKPVVSLKKIKDVPYTQDGTLLNTVYVARKGDTWKGLSEKIYGSADKAKELKSVNPYFSYRELKVGDKVYYNSPKRPQDSEKMLTYYEDSGIPAQTYVAKAGDNIRAISKDLLGDKNSWKEVWATNLAVESKGELPEGTELRYWPEGQVAAVPAPAPAEQVAQQNPQPTQPAVANNPQPQQPQTDDFALPDDMSKNQANNNNNPSAAAGTVAVEPPPPPPPPPPVQTPQKSVASNNPMDKDMTFMLSAGGLLLVGLGVLLGIIRKSRARKMSMNTHTQI